MGPSSYRSFVVGMVDTVRKTICVLRSSAGDPRQFSSGAFRSESTFPIWPLKIGSILHLYTKLGTKFLSLRSRHHETPRGIDAHSECRATGGVLTTSVDVGRASSGNSDHIRSGNSDHPPLAIPGQMLAGDPVPSEGRDDRHAQATRGSSSATGGAQSPRRGPACRSLYSCAG